MTACTLSGPPIDGFRQGWAILPFVGSGIPHFWRRRELTHSYRSLCGLEQDQSTLRPGARVQLEPGDFKANRCRKCRSALKRRDY